MKYTVSLSSEVTRYLRRMDGRTQPRIAGKIETLRTYPFDPRFSKLLKGPGGFRSARVGGLRMIFVVVQTELLITIERTGPRGQVYRDL